MPRKNLPLSAVLDTDLRTAKAAEWFVSLIHRLADQAPVGSRERGYQEAYATDVESALEDYRQNAGKPKDDPGFTRSYKYLCDILVGRLSSARAALFAEAPPALPTVEQYEERVRSLLEAADWHFSCSFCERATGNRKPVDGQIVCDRCRISKVGTCQSCREEHLAADMSRLMSASDPDGVVLYCRGHVPKGLKTCTRCSYMFEGAANHKHSHAKELTAAGIKACPNCSRGYRKLSCGHWNYGDGQRRPVVVHTEDDDRIGERIRENAEMVCHNCYDEERRNERVEYWDAAEERLNGSLFTELGSLRTYGVELEFCRARNLPKLGEGIKNYWSAKGDGSLPSCGLELASTVLQGDEGLKVIGELCEFAKENDWQVDARGGLHLHIGLARDKPAEVAAIAMGYLLTYELWRWFVPPSRSKACKYCRRLATAPDGMLGIDYHKYPRILAENDDRRVWCNWHSYSKFTTVEIRLHHATRMYDKVANWAKAHLRFCDWCASLGNPKKVHAKLKPLVNDPRALLLVIGTEAWKDRGLVKWYRQRSAALHGDQSPLRSHRSLRQSGLDPKKPVVKPVRPTIQGVPVYVVEIGGTTYLASMENGESTATERARYISEGNVWGDGYKAIHFSSSRVAELYIAEHRDQPAVVPPAEPLHYQGLTVQVVESRGVYYVATTEDRLHRRYIQTDGGLNRGGAARTWISRERAERWLGEHADEVVAF